MKYLKKIFIAFLLLLMTLNLFSFSHEGYQKNEQGNKIVYTGYNERIDCEEYLVVFTERVPENYRNIINAEFLSCKKQVSHDRYLLKEITNRVFEVDHGHINIYDGDYQYYLSCKKG